MKKILALCMLVCICLSMAACQTPVDGTTTAATVGRDVLHTVNVLTSGGSVPSGIKYKVYKGASKTDGVAAYGTLDSGGKITFTAPENGKYMLILEEVAEGYDVQPSYLVENTQTDLVLTSAVIQGAAATDKVYYIGDVMRDFTITDTDGNSHTISELLKTKKAVVLNFWNITCDPCKAEFPHLQKAYEAYKDEIALIAMDPVKTDSESGIKDFKQKFGLSFPMASCDPAWVAAMAPMGNPTTVIIDRYGVICVKETGGIAEGVFEAVFAHFVAEDYQQIQIPNMTEFAQSEDAA